MTKGSIKGGAFERLCGRELSSWLTDGEDDSQLIRSVSSGGWARRKVRQVGDLAPNGEAGLAFRLVFGVECKNRQEFEWRHVWTSDDPALFVWWRKHIDECAEADLVPIIMFKRNYEPILIGFPQALPVGDWPRTMTVSFDDDVLHFVPFERFATVVSPAWFLAWGERAVLRRHER